MSADAHATRTYTKLLLGLGVLTAVTVGLSQVDFHSKAANITVGLVVAVIKASLVIMIFMHLWHEKRSWLWMVLFPMILVMIMIFANLPDTGLNGGDKGDLLSPALKVIPHAGRAAGGH